eukprot:1192981-Prorocentrum_minimum.AAC.2
MSVTGRSTPTDACAEANRVRGGGIWTKGEPIGESQSGEGRGHLDEAGASRLDASLLMSWTLALLFTTVSAPSRGSQSDRG